MHLPTGTAATVPRRRVFRRDEEGASMVEYALIVALIALIAFVALGPLGNTIRDVFRSAEEAIPGTESSENG